MFASRRENQKKKKTTENIFSAPMQILSTTCDVGGAGTVEAECICHIQYNAHIYVCVHARGVGLNIIMAHDT